MAHVIVPESIADQEIQIHVGNRDDLSRILIDHTAQVGNRNTPVLAVGDENIGAAVRISDFRRVNAYARGESGDGIDRVPNSSGGRLRRITGVNVHRRNDVNAVGRCSETLHPNRESHPSRKETGEVGAARHAPRGV